MSDQPIHITLVTLGVDDVQASAAFYEKLGLKRSSASQEEVAFFDMGGLALGLFGRESLALDAGVPAGGTGFNSFSLAWNQPDEASVDASLDRAVKAGGKLVKAAEKVFWGGYSGYFADLDGHLWEVAHNPFAPLRENRSMELPE
ncbi:VOC family protein [Henriciella sp. AS95]|uniref:VOC family protein n=1 Tax=Henriciella sp. AS95 TaxID=3135782 RepID=UPI00318003B7